MVEPDEDVHSAEEILRHAAARSLARRPRLRFFAVVLWSSFLGAVMILAAWLLSPHDLAFEPITFARLAGVFVAAWLLSLIPAISAALLIGPPGRNDET